MLFSNLPVFKFNLKLSFSTLLLICRPLLAVIVSGYIGDAAVGTCGGPLPRRLPTSSLYNYRINCHPLPMFTYYISK